MAKTANNSATVSTIELPSGAVPPMIALIAIILSLSYFNVFESAGASSINCAIKLEA